MAVNTSSLKMTAPSDPFRIDYCFPQHTSQPCRCVCGSQAAPGTVRRTTARAVSTSQRSQATAVDVSTVYEAVAQSRESSIGVWYSLSRQISCSSGYSSTTILGLATLGYLDLRGINEWKNWLWTAPTTTELSVLRPSSSSPNTRHQHGQR